MGLGKIKNILSEVAEAGAEVVNAISWAVGAAPRAFGPKDPEDTLERAKRVSTVPDARGFIDSIIGKEPTDQYLLEILRDKGMVSRVLYGTPGEALEAGGLALMPFTSNDNALRAVGGAQEYLKGLDPYRVGDKYLQNRFRSNERLQMLYLRETDPMALVKAIVETDAERNPGGGGFFDRAKDMGGRLIGWPKAAFFSVLHMPERIEQTIGWYTYNEVPDTHLRWSMAHRFYEYRLNLWDWDMRHENDAKLKIDEVLGRGLTGEAAVQELETFFQKQPLGAAGVTADLFGKIVYDPLWFVPVGWIAKPVAAGIKVTTGAPKVSRLLRFLNPAARGAKGTRIPGFESWRKIFQMPEQAYSQGKFASPARGVTRFLSERDPNTAARAIRQRLLQWTAPAKRAGLYDDPARVNDLVKTISTGKPTGWIEKNIPGLLDDPLISEFSARAGKDNWLARVFREEHKGIHELLDETARIGNKRDELLKLLPGNKAWAREIDDIMARGENVADWAGYAKRQFDENLVLTGAESVMREAQIKLYGATSLGEFMLKRWIPVVNTLRPTIALLTINNPGFVFLNVVSNFVRHMWSGWRHPMRSFQVYGRSLGIEASAVFKAGGKVPDEWARMLVPLGLDPLDVERFVSSQAGMQEVLFARAMAKAEPDAVELMTMFRKQASQPVKHLMEDFRWRDAIAWPVYGAGRMDAAARRATFYNSLLQQGGLAAVPSWVARGPIPPVADRLVEMGIKRQTGRQIEGRVVDETRAFLSGMAGKDITRENMYVMLDAVAAEVEAGRPVISLTDIAYRWAKQPMEKGGLGLLDDEAARFALQDVWPVSDRMLEVMKTDLPALVAGEISYRSFSGKLDALVMEYYGMHDVAARMARTPSMIRGSTSYLDGLRLTDQAIYQEMVDTTHHLELHLKNIFPAWKTTGRRTLKEFNQAAGDATAGCAERLSEIARLEREAMLATGEKMAARDSAKLWDDYFRFKDESYEKLYTFMRENTEKVHTGAVRPLDEWWKNTQETFAQHREIIRTARAAPMDEAQEAWRVAGEKIRRLYEQNAQLRGEIFGWGHLDLPEAMQHLDQTAPLAKEVDQFAQFVKQEVKASLPDLRAGKVGIAETEKASVAKVLRGSADELYDNAVLARQQIIGNAKIQTDFVMLDYNAQYGLDRAMQMFAPFWFWPTRDAAHWVKRVVQAPGAGMALYQMMMSPKQFAEAYGLPERMHFQIPIMAPGLEEAFSKIPFASTILGDTNFGPAFFIDPIRFVFPFWIYRDQWEEEKRRSTPLGLVLDWTENWSPMNMSPFMKIIGSETGLLDKDAWGTVQFGGGPFGIPISTTAQATARWLFAGDLDAIPEEEQNSYVEFGHFTPSWLGRILNLEPDRWDLYRGERSAWAMAATDDLVPGGTHEENVRAAWEAIDTHKGVPWARAMRSAGGETFLRSLTYWIGFPAGGVTGMQEGEWIYAGLRTAYSEYARQGRISEFFEKYPEFEVRSAVTKGIDDPEEKRRAVDTELYYQDIERLVDTPYKERIEYIEGKLWELAQMTQDTAVRDQTRVIKDELERIRGEQGKLRDLVSNMYPERMKELSLYWPPRDRALREVRSDWYDIIMQEGESYDAYQERQQQFLNQFPAVGEGGFEPKDWGGAYQEYLLIRLQFGELMRQASKEDDWDRINELRDEREAALRALHEDMGKGLTRRDVESYISSFSRQKTPEEMEFEEARDMMDLWMSLVARGTPLTGSEKGAISDFFRAQPEIQKHYPLEAIPLENMPLAMRLQLLRRDEIWDHYYDLHDPDLQLAYMRQIKPELDMINAQLGIPPLQIIDTRTIAPSLGAGDPLVARIEMMLAAQRERKMQQEGEEEDIDPETLAEYSRLLASDASEPTPWTGDDLDYFTELWAAPEE